MDRGGEAAQLEIHVSKNSTRRYDKFLAKVERAVLQSQGHTQPGLRQDIASRRSSSSNVPDALRSYADKVALRAYTVSDADIEGLLRAGYNEDEIFEVTVAAALGAALERLERGLAMLEEPAQ
jgi:alkylhydroperoxidase family enzyme